MADEALVTISKNVDVVGRKKLAAAALLYLTDSDATTEPDESNIATWLTEKMTRDAIKSIAVMTGDASEATTVDQAIGKINRMTIHTLVGVFPDQTPEVALGRSIVSSAIRANIGKLSARALACLCPDRACKTNKTKVENICLKLFPGLCISTWDMRGVMPLPSLKKGAKDEVDEETEDEEDEESDDDLDDRDYNVPSDGEEAEVEDDDEVIPVVEEEEGVLDDVVDEEEEEEEEKGEEEEVEVKDEKEAEDEKGDEEDGDKAKDEKDVTEEVEEKKDDDEETSEPVKKKPKKTPKSDSEKHHHHHHHKEKK